MMTLEILELLKSQGVTIEIDGDFLEVTPAGKITADLLERLRQHKPQIIAELMRERRRARVLTMLAENPSIKRAFVTDYESDPGNVILTMAIRSMASFEMLIPRDKYDPFMLIELIEKGSVQ